MYVMVKTFSAIVIGALLGVVGSRILFVGSALSLAPWAVVGLALGWVGREKTGLMPIRGHSGVQGGAEVGCVPAPGEAAVRRSTPFR